MKHVLVTLLAVALVAAATAAPVAAADIQLGYLGVFFGTHSVDHGAGCSEPDGVQKRKIDAGSWYLRPIVHAQVWNDCSSFDHASGSLVRARLDVVAPGVFFWASAEWEERDWYGARSCDAHADSYVTGRAATTACPFDDGPGLLFPVWP